jgi:branched-chain amino acid transport system ATP-binding protein
MADAPWQLIWHTAARRHMERVLREGLEIFGLQHVHQTRAGDLPLLESRCLEILRILLQDPQLLLLDEPCAGLNQSHASHILDAIRTFRPRVAMVIVEHQVSLLHVYCDRQLLLEGGQLHSLG